MREPAGLETSLRKILERYARQNSWETSAPVDSIAARLAEFLRAEKIAPGPGEVPDAEAARWTARVLETVAPEWAGRFAVPVKQLLKACGTSPLPACRDTFREAGVDGGCRRQELGRARARASGVHCIDCPYWEEFSCADHRDFLRAEWKADVRDLENNWETYLPEDFRDLRQWLADVR